ncbi:PhnD/SsuA/transferrin family substrate-binding protein [Xenophilus arseniciresistens]|uniref:PhnD/SsuA/transferrin family substrate-binding protein n=1 Tax=Xenophilus arseniciresistens TaxID=1283306 RepID=A0AAE3NCW0_9BURK|nr:PhnD/SsuA/transferrin family substrate-binding protein [Xenophilus arseniciresistens]MDA7418749.1 PhnD/SsuA/transferrin family substrate-binding protein [Xenophilus arseniciresistens]
MQRLPIPCAPIAAQRRALLLAALAAGLFGMNRAPAQTFEPRRRRVHESGFVRFAALPVGGAVDWRRHWDVLLAALGAALQWPVSGVAVLSQEMLARSIEREQVDVAFLAGPLALEAVVSGRMEVVAQMRAEPLGAPHALLLARRTDMPADLEELLAQPERWRIARGEERSLTGFLIPQTRLMLPRRLPLETGFMDERIGSAQDNLLALANGDVDLCTTGSMHLASFAQQFPQEAARLRVVWQSEPVPRPVVLVRSDAPEPWKAQVRDFFLQVGEPTAPSPWRFALAALHMPQGFGPADNRVLLPVAQLALELGRLRAQGAQWVSEAARQARLERLAQTYARQLRVLHRSKGY